MFLAIEKKSVSIVCDKFKEIKKGRRLYEKNAKSSATTKCSVT